MKEKAREYFTSEAYAVIGASKNREKYGNIVLRTMKDRNIEVYPVNPKEKEIEDLQCYSTVDSLPASVGAVVTVVPPQVTEKVVEVCHAKGIKNIWMQPGSESPVAVSKAEEYGINVIYDTCIINFLRPFSSLREARERLAS